MRTVKLKRKRHNWKHFRERFLELRAKLKRVVRPHDVLQDARNPRSVFHSYIEWDDRKASEKYRLQQARELVSRLKMIYVNAAGKEINVREYVHLQVETPDRRIIGGYVPRQQAVKTSHFQSQMIDLAIRDLIAFKRRYACFREIEAAYTFLDACINRLQKSRIRKLRRAQ